MRPLELRLAHFGPYRDQAILNFEALDRLFLVCGPTGAGKTTLFDALTYALYEKTTGTRGGLTDQLASHHAELGAVPEVSLRFALADQQWRVTRQLRHNVPKKRGEGWTTQEPQVLLERRENDSWVPVPGKRSELNDKIEDLVGLSAEEFAKIVVLPQGDFQRFLEASSGDREKMLQKLFPIELYERLVEGLKARAKTAEEQKKRWEDRWQDLSVQLGSTTEERQSLEARWAEAESQVQFASQAEHAATEALVRLKALHADWDRLVAKRREQDQLQETRTSVEADRAVLDAAKAVRPLLSDVDRQQAVLAEGKRLRADQDAAKVQKEAAATEHGRWTAGASERQKRRERLAQVLQERGVAEDQAKQWQAVADLERQERELRAVEETQRQEAQTARSVREELEARLVAPPPGPPLAEALQDLDKARLVRQRADLRLQRDEAATEREAKAAPVAEAERELLIWNQVVEVLQAAALAQHLVADQPCPVCGSALHPKPAQWPEASAEAPVRQAEAQQALERARATWTSAQARWETLESQLAALPATGPEQSVADAQQCVAACEQHVAALQKWSAEQERLRSEVTQAVDRAAATTQALQAASQKRETVTVRLADLRTRIPQDPTALLARLQAEESNLTRQIEGEQRTEDELARRQAGLQSKVEALEEQLEAQREDYRTRQARLDAALEALALTLEQVRLARRTEAEINRLEALVAEFDRAVSRLATEIGALEARVAEQPPPVAPAEAEREALGKIRERLTQEAKELEFALRERDRIEEQLRELNREKVAVEAEFQRLVPLARALDGNNPLNLKLTTWVLIQALEQVAHSATHRLASMSGGRYALKVQSRGSDARKDWGLDLAVVDGYTGQERAVGTLSGGEKFMTSISLALGLADVIQEKSGGLKLEAIFIDEGFGTLDDQSLDRAMAILHDLGKHRSVGIISHVAELRQRISSRVEVVKGKNGSSLRQDS